MKYMTIASLTGAALFSLLPACSGTYDTERDPSSSEALTATSDQQAAHCALEFDVVSEDGKDLNRATHEMRCFDTFAEAVQFASAGRINLAPDSAPSDLDDATVDEANAVAAERYVLGIEYEHRHHKGKTATFYSDTTCIAKPMTNFDVASMPPGWDNEISAAKAYSGCRHAYHYEHTNFRGDMIDTKTSNGAMGDMNDKTSSIRYHR